MKKIGFTLAEVLITLGIVGVVAALTAPALVQNAATAQTGPKLAKAVSTLEVANQNFLTQMSADTLAAAGAYTGDSKKSAINYIKNLSNYMKISYYDETGKSKQYKDMLRSYNEDSSNSYVSGAPGDYGVLSALALYYLGLSKDGVLYGFCQSLVDNSPNGIPAHQRLEGLVLIDINGFAEPNRVGRDAFFFVMYKDGSLKPIGGNQWSTDESLNASHNWETGTRDKCNATEVTSGWSCAGSIFENDQKVIYQ